MCSTEVTQPVGATYTRRASACAMAVRTEWVNVQPGSHEDRGGRERIATRREPAGGAIGAHSTAPQTPLWDQSPLMGKQVFRGDTTLTSVTLPAKLWELLCICPFTDEHLQTGLESIQKQYLEGLKESSVPSVRRGLSSEGPAQWLETPAPRPRSSPHQRVSARPDEWPGPPALRKGSHF